jgi:hypothetical protein
MTIRNVQRSLTASAVTTITTRTTYISHILSLFTAQNLIVLVGLLTVGGSAFKWLKSQVSNYLLTKYLICQTYNAGSENKIILETYIKSICRDPYGRVRIRGEDEQTKVSAATKEEEDVLTYDKDKFDIEVAHLPPLVSKFVHSTAEAMFFHVLDPQDEPAQPQKRLGSLAETISEYIVVVSANDSTLKLFVPLMLRNALHDLWSKTVRRWLIQTLTRETYQSLVNLFVDKNKDKTNHIKLYALRSSAKRLSLFFKEAERFHRESKTKALYIHDMMFGQKFKAQPRPMSTIAIEPGSGLDLLTEDVERFWSQRKKLEKNDLPFQRVHLLHGPPGNGKSSILQALAIQYEIPYYYLDANAVTKADVLRSLLIRYTTHERCLVVIEDAESALPKPESYNDRFGGKKRRNGSDNIGSGAINPNGSGSMASQQQQSKKSSGNAADEEEDEQEDEDEEEKLSVKEFIELINGSQSPRPAGRLICLTTNTLDALPAEVLQLVNSQGNLFEFPNAGEATMKGYWKNFFQSDDWWEEFWVHYSNVWGGHVDEETGDNVRLHSAAALQKYCMRFRGKPQEASLYQNVLTFRPSSASTKDTHDVEIAAAQDPSTSTVTTGAEEQEQEQEQSVLRSIPLSRQGSHTFARQHNIPHHVASKLLNEHGREWTSASKALKAQQIKVFETNRTAIVKPLLNDEIRLSMTSSLSVLLMSFGLFGSNLLKKIMDPKTLTSVLLLLPALTASWSWYERWERNHHVNFVLEERATIGLAMAKWLERRISYMTSKFTMQPLIASHLRQGPIQSKARDFKDVVNVTSSDGPMAYCVSTKDKTASITPEFQFGKWLRLTVELPPLEDQKNGKNLCDTMEISFMMDAARRIVLRQETRQEKQLRRQLRGYKRKDQAISRSLNLCVARQENTKLRIKQVLQMALEEHAQDNLNQVIKILDVRTIEGKLANPGDEYYSQRDVFQMPGLSSEIKRLDDKSFKWPNDDAHFCRSLQMLVDDAILFDKSKEFYTLRGIPFRRSYLLSGPEASGKEYFVRYLAHRLGREICIIDFSKPAHRRISNAGLAMAVNSLGSNAILIMRHLDSLVSASEGGAGRGAATVNIRHPGMRGRRKRECVPLTYSGILNVLDGPCAHNNGLITIMTTLRFEKLKQDTRTVTALLRAGRCAKHVRFQLPTRMQVRGLFLTMFSNEKVKKDEFIENAVKKQQSSAMISENEDIVQVSDAFVVVLKEEGRKYLERRREAEMNASMEPLAKGDENEHEVEVEVEVEEKEKEKEKEKKGKEQKEQGSKKRANKSSSSNIASSPFTLPASSLSSLSCWTSVVDWDAIKGYLRPFLHKGHHDCADENRVLQFLKTQQQTRRQQLNQQIDLEMEKVDEALRLNPKRKADIAKRESSSFDAQFVYDQIVSKSTGWASLSEVEEDDETLYCKMSTLHGKLEKLNLNKVNDDQKTKPKCSHGHPLKRIVDMFSNARCDGSKANGDRCGASLQRGRPKYSCKKNGCDWDTCRNCYLREQKKLKKAAKANEKKERMEQEEKAAQAAAAQAAKAQVVIQSKETINSKAKKQSRKERTKMLSMNNGAKDGTESHVSQGELLQMLKEVHFMLKNKKVEAVSQTAQDS